MSDHQPNGAGLTPRRKTPSPPKSWAKGTDGLSPAASSDPGDAASSGETGGSGVPPSTPDQPDAPVSIPDSSPVQPGAVALEAAEIASHILTPAPEVNPVVAALKKSDFYCEALGGGSHAYTCHRAAEHPDRLEVKAVYREPTLTHPYGRCVCNHAHTPAVDVEQLLEELRVSRFEASGKARIRLHPGETQLVVRAVELMLAKGPYFHSGGRLMRLAWDQGRISVERPNEHTISAELAASFFWERPLEKKWAPCDPPRAVVQPVLHNQNRAYLRPLEGVARQPVLRPDGSLVTEPGYDPITRIYADFRRDDYPFGLASEETARRALDYLLSLLVEFEFRSEADKAAFLSAMLTAAVRPSLSQAPAYLFTAPESGSGKSYAATLISLFATSAPPHAVSYPSTAEEATKLFPSLLRSSPPVILFDDTQANWAAHGAINKALTSPTVTERELGINGLITVPTNSLFLGTGNNIRPLGDLRRRVVTITLRPLDDTPATRRFQFDPVQAVRADRPRAVMAALEIIRAYQLAGCPAQDVPSINGFRDWSRWCRASLIWLGLPDPGKTLIGQLENDPERLARKRLLILLYDRFDSDPTQVQEMIAAAGRYPEIAEALEDLHVVDREGVNAKKLGQYLKHKCSSPTDGWRVEEYNAPRGRRAWIVHPPTGGDPSGGRGPMGPRPFRPFGDDEPTRPRKIARTG